MVETEIEKKLDFVVHICRENYRLCKALIDCITNQGVATDRSLKDIEIRIDSLKKDMQEYDRLRAKSDYHYTDGKINKNHIFGG
jgi:predicted translin family RNA/ssDNA-binding protein